MELDLQSLFGLMCTAVLIGWGPSTPPPPSRIWARKRGGYWLAKMTSLCNPLLENKAILLWLLDRLVNLHISCVSCKNIRFQSFAFLLKEMPGSAVCAGWGGSGLHPREPLRLRGGQRRQQHHRLRTPTERVHHGITRYNNVKMSLKGTASRAGVDFWWHKWIDLGP